MKDRIKEIRMSMGLSQGEFAQRLSDVTLGVNVIEETVQKWELGTEQPLPSGIEALAFLSKRSINWIQSAIETDDKVQKVPDDGTIQKTNADPSEENVSPSGANKISNVIQFPDND